MPSLEFNSPYLNQYLQMVEETESPRVFHLWNAIGIAAAAMGRRCFFEFGPAKIYPNHYILCVGTPATRKSSSLSVAKKLLQKSTGVQLAPDDTAGQRQGLIRAMMQNSSRPQMYVDGMKMIDNDDTLNSGLSLQQLAMATDEAPSDEQYEVDKADSQHLLATSDEFSTFVGENSATLLDFLTRCWDGTSYIYQTKESQTVLKSPLLNIIGCTTPVSLARSMPKAVAGQGLLSRMILVYGSRKYKRIPRPIAFDPDREAGVREILSNIYSTMYGAFTETDDAKKYSVELYDYTLEITDSRFGYYAERRYTHLIKLAMVLAACRGDQIIVRDDYHEAHRILRATERGMPDALGEFGMNALGTLKQSILEFMRDVAVMSLDELRGHFHRDARSSEFMEALNDLVKNRQIALQQNKTSGAVFVSALIGKFHTDDKIIDVLSQAT